MLTKKQYELLLFIDKRLKENGVSPSFDEMKDAASLEVRHSSADDRTGGTRLRATPAAPGARAGGAAFTGKRRWSDAKHVAPRFGGVRAERHQGRLQVAGTSGDPGSQIVPLPTARSRPVTPIAALRDHPGPLKFPRSCSAEVITMPSR